MCKWREKERPEFGVSKRQKEKRKTKVRSVGQDEM